MFQILVVEDETAWTDLTQLSIISVFVIQKYSGQAPAIPEILQIPIRSPFRKNLPCKISTQHMPVPKTRQPAFPAARDKIMSFQFHFLIPIDNTILDLLVPGYNVFRDFVICFYEL